MQREDSSLLQKQEIKCYLSKPGVLYANNYMVQNSFFFLFFIFNMLSSMDAIEGRQLQGLKRVSLMEPYSGSPS